MNTQKIRNDSKLKEEKEDNLHLKVNKNIDFENFFENSITVSEIENKENEQKKFYLNDEDNNINNIENSINNDINLEDQSINELNKEIKKSKNNNFKKKITKEDLNNIPLPIFSCIYCSNDYISFKHLSNEKLSSKYYIQTSIYDMKILDKLIQKKPLIDQYNQNSQIIDIIIKNTEYLKKYYSTKDSMAFFNNKKYKSFYINNNLKIKNFFLKKFENFIIKKKNKDLTNKKITGNKYTNKNISYNKLSFHNNNSNSIVNDNCNNLLGNIKNNNNTFGTGTCQGTGSYSLSNNIISFSLNNNDNNNNNININMNNVNNILCFNNLNILENIMEKIEKNEESENDEEGGEEFLNIFGNESQIQNKINKNNISFEDKFYDIWNPNITTINDEIENVNEIKVDEIKENNNNINNDFNILNNPLKNEKNSKNDFSKIKNNFHINNNNYGKNVNNKLSINKIGKIEKIENNNLQKIYSDRRINEIKQLFNYSHTSYLNNNILKNKKINIKKKEVNKINFDLNKNNENQNKNNIDYPISKDYFKNNLFKFKSFYMNKNRKNINNNNNNNSNKNLLHYFNNKKSTNIDNAESLYHTKDLNKENEKSKKKENEKIKNMTISTCNQEPKNLLFLLKYPKTTSHSNKINQKIININVSSPKIIKKPFSSYKNSKNNENFILIKPQERLRNATSRVKKSVDKDKLNFNYIISDFYENNIKIHNSRNYISKRRAILDKNKNNYGNMIKSNSFLMNGQLKEKKSNNSSCTNFQINFSKIFFKNKANEKINELMKKINKNNNYKININDFAFSNNKKAKEIKDIKEIRKNAQKLNINMHVPLINKRSTSVTRPLMQKKNMIKLKI